MIDVFMVRRFDQRESEKFQKSEPSHLHLHHIPITLQGYEPMMSHEERMANAQMNQLQSRDLQSRPLPPRTLNMSG